MKASLSVILICQDEADRIRACLESVAVIADEIIVIDSGSRDGTIGICREFTPYVHEMDWPGYGPQKQRALSMATGDWVLSIDADERVSPELAGRIRRVLECEQEISAYRVKIIAEVYGRTLKHGRTTKYGWRLFRRHGARFNEKRIHEHVIPAPGPTARLHEPIHHETYRDFHHAMAKFDRYARDWASEQFERGRRSGPGIALLRSFSTFLKCYLFRLGMLDGRHGLVLATQFAMYTFNKYAALWYLTRRL